VKGRKLGGLSVSTSYNGTWFLPNGLGASYYITDVDGLTYYYVGTFCGQYAGAEGDDNADDEDNEACEIELPEGEYIYRVDGAFDPQKDQITWTFCETTGGVSEELQFTIDEDGECEPIKKYDLEDICSREEYMNAQSFITLSGTFELGGMQVPRLTSSEELLIKSALNKEFTETSTHRNVNDVVTVTSLATSVKGTDHRSLLVGGVNEVSFQVKVASELYGLQGTKESKMIELANSIKGHVAKSMSSGIFVAKVVSLAHEGKVENLQTVNFAKLVDLQYVHESVVNEKLSGFASSVIVVGALVGVAFGLLVYRATRPVSEHMLLDTTERPMPSAVPHLASIHDSIMDSDRMQAAL